ncbi:MAG: hypothetical protein K2X57_29080 [Xanthobacteraceae bacterium]|nr:hypothetical protein [Xanthobacteraceae bacterium]
MPAGQNAIRAVKLEHSGQSSEMHQRSSVSFLHVQHSDRGAATVDVATSLKRESDKIERLGEIYSSAGCYTGVRGFRKMAPDAA